MVTNKRMEEQSMGKSRCFDIEDGRLREYTGPGGDLVIPEGVKK